ncbi:hypothetical protein AVEN_182000-1 [Araneus ventricosus]|uniref:Uncharacterized protein n=1 Tax=Araneus ventricosus TaxID=182803 RepID=A0A4Y2CJZ1_ARAVE|nr:hypothetical protein AVEN_182000-1 [Araneus ventricosus]
MTTNTPKYGTGNVFGVRTPLNNYFGVSSAGRTGKQQCELVTAVPSVKGKYCYKDVMSFSCLVSLMVRKRVLQGLLCNTVGCQVRLSTLATKRRYSKMLEFSRISHRSRDPDFSRDSQ